MLVINQRIQSPLREFRFTFSRSPGPGGQNVNKVNSKAALHWAVTTTASLPEPVRERFIRMFAPRINQRGDLFLASSRFRDAGRNVADCLEKLRAMVAAAAATRRARCPTKPTASSQRRRLQQKRLRSEKKQSRRRIGDD